MIQTYLVLLAIVCAVMTEGWRSTRKKANVDAKDPKSVKGKDGLRPTHLAFYPPRWKSFLREAKEECRARHAIDKPFPSLTDDLTDSLTKALLAVQISWDQAGKELEADIWPHHQADMARLLYNDLTTWRSDLKKTAITLAPTVYTLVPPSNIPFQERTAWVESAATELLKISEFLRDGFDSNGKTRNFANPALREAVIVFFYTGPYRVARKRPEIFRKQVPLPCLALVAAAYNCVLDGLSKNGSGKWYPKFTAKEYGSIYACLLKLLEQIMEDPYHGPKLVEQLESWAQIGWAASRNIDGHVDGDIDDDVECLHPHLQIKLG
ncbi:hypothetical protein P692DRAFT_20467922 [Suillus brevipes Sb2]|nr:hypothetical protein P692DRAFT_20467922 [Suillus brevipes Sb2]